MPAGEEKKKLWDSNLEHTAYRCWKLKKNWARRRKLTKTYCKPFTKGWGALTAAKDQAVKTQAEKKNATRVYGVAANCTHAALLTEQPPEIDANHVSRN